MISAFDPSKKMWMLNTQKTTYRFPPGQDAVLLLRHEDVSTGLGMDEAEATLVEQYKPRLVANRKRPIAEVDISSSDDDYNISTPTPRPRVKHRRDRSPTTPIPELSFMPEDKTFHAVPHPIRQPKQTSVRHNVSKLGSSGPSLSHKAPKVGSSNSTTSQLPAGIPDITALKKQPASKHAQ